MLQKTETSLSFDFSGSTTNLFYTELTLYNNKDTLFFCYINQKDTSLKIIPYNKRMKKILPIKSISYAKLFVTEIPSAFKGDKLQVAIYVDSPNTIWISPTFSDTFYVCDINKREIIKSYHIKKELNTIIYDYNPEFIFSNGKYLLFGLYNYNSNASFGLYKKLNNVLIQEKELGYRPRNYNNKDMYIYSGIFTKTDNESFIVSYHFSDSVDIYKDYKFVRRVMMKSDSSKIFKGFIGNRSDINDISHFFLMNQRYEKLMYDSLDQLYYRVFSIEEENKNLILPHKKWSISVFDKDFNKIHEEFLYIKDYAKYHVFLIDGKLFIESIVNNNYQSTIPQLVLDEFKLIEK